MSIAMTSLWNDSRYVRKGDRLKGDLSCDVCVVGAGIAGLTTAFLLAREGKSVVILERNNEFANAETARTTAHLSNVLDDRFAVLEKTRGVEVSRYAYESHSGAINLIESIVASEKIDCDFLRVDGYLVPHSADAAQSIEDEYQAAKRAGVIVDRVEEGVPPHFSGPCLRFAQQAQLHPLKYLSGVANAFQNAGGRIFVGASVNDYQDGPQPTAKTSDGHTVSANALVLATNTPLGGGVSVNLRIAAYTSHAIAARIPKGTFPPKLIWDTEEPYHYVRVQQEADGNEYLIIGGEDHKTGQVSDQVERWERLESWAKSHFTNLGAVTHWWSGQVFETLDGLALIGPDPAGAENVYIATGDSGMGMTHGTIAGLLLTDLILRRENEWSALYAPSRFPIAATGTVAKEGLNMANQFTDWFIGGDVSDIEQIEPGRGAVVRRGLKKVAVYRDQYGNTHEMSAVCPHMSCVVHWNHGESTWDCPCHGSRFSAHGRVIHGPAMADLAPAKPVMKEPANQ